MTIKNLTLGVAALALVACSNSADVSEPVTEIVDAAAEAVAEAVETVEAVEAVMSLDDILAMQSEDMQARYTARNPGQTLAYFGIEPGMTVAEVLPGGGWYSKILIPYLGDDGTLVGIDYSLPMWGKFGGFATQEFLDDRKNWAETWTGDAQDWRSGSEADIVAFPFGSRLADLEGQVDAVLMIRAMHHLTRFDRAHLQEALDDMQAILKPDGIVGIVQHRGPETNSDDWANGDNGYLKQSEVIKIMEAAGFELIGDPSEINANPKDQPTSDDAVWRLPPTLGTSRDNPELKAKLEAVGETDRMTLKFRRAS